MPFDITEVLILEIKSNYIGALFIKNYLNFELLNIYNLI